MQQNLSLENQNILVTGVSRASGIGAEIAKKLANAGAKVITHGNPNYDAERKYSDADRNFCLELAEAEQIKVLEPSDLSAKDEPARVIANARQAFGSLDGLVLNHAYSVNSTIFDCTAENIDHHLQINVRASMLMIKEFARQIDSDCPKGLASRRGGAITLFTSGQYLGAMTDEIAYAVSKEAIRGLCTQAAAALAKQKIRVNCINPGATDTNYLTGTAYAEVAKMFPNGRWGTPDDAAKLVHFLHSDYASWITGQTIASEGGFVR